MNGTPYVAVVGQVIRQRIARTHRVGAVKEFQLAAIPVNVGLRAAAVGEAQINHLQPFVIGHFEEGIDRRTESLAFDLAGCIELRFAPLRFAYFPMLQPHKQKAAAKRKSCGSFGLLE